MKLIGGGKTFVPDLVILIFLDFNHLDLNNPDVCVPPLEQLAYRWPAVR